MAQPASRLLVFAIALMLPAGASGVAIAASNEAAPITVEVGLHDQQHRSFLDRLLDEDTEQSELELERSLRGRPWLEVVSHEGEVLVEVTRRWVSESSRSKEKDGRISVSWRFALRGSIRLGNERDVLEASSTSSETLSESDANRRRRETYADRATFERLARELADKANGWILERVEQLRPGRPDAGFRHQAKYKWLVKGDGLEVTDVMPGSPAARAGLRVGDRIRLIDEEKGTNEMDLRVRTWWIERPGTRVRIEFDRDKKRQAVVCDILPSAEWEGGHAAAAADPPPPPVPAARTMVPAAAEAATTSVRVQPGMRPEQVERVLGRPLRQVTFESKTVWTYDGFRVVFVNGVVTDVQ